MKTYQDFENFIKKFDVLTPDDNDEIQSFISTVKPEDQRKCLSLYLMAYSESVAKSAQKLALIKATLPYNYNAFYEYQYVFLPFAYYTGLYKDIVKDDFNFDLYRDFTKINKIKEDFTPDLLKSEIIENSGKKYQVLTFEDDMFHVEPLSKHIILPIPPENPTVNSPISLYFTLEYSMGNSLFLCYIIPASEDIASSKFARDTIQTVSTLEEGLDKISEILERLEERNLYDKKVYKA